MPERQWRLLRVLTFWAALLFSYVCAVMPGEAQPTFGGSDKTDHICAFLVLTILASTANPRRPRWFIGVALSLYGIFIELSQAAPLVNRDASVADWIADSLAILVGLAIASLLRRFAPRLFAD